MVPTFLIAAWCGDTFHRLGVQDVIDIDSVDALFLLDGRRRREGEKKKREITVRKEVSLGLDCPAGRVMGCIS
jgi:hypothetical protein